MQGGASEQVWQVWHYCIELLKPGTGWMGISGVKPRKDFSTIFHESFDLGLGRPKLKVLESRDLFVSCPKP